MPSPPLDVILAGGGARARAYAELIARSPKLRLVAGVVRSGSPALSSLTYRTLEEALAAHPGAVVVAALPPRASLAAARILQAAGRGGLLEAPLAPGLTARAAPAGAGRSGLLEAPLAPGLTVGTGPAALQVAHGWVTLPGWRAIAQLLAARPGAGLRLATRGLPGAADAEPEEALPHALALARRLLPSARVLSASRPTPDSIEVVLGGSGGGLTLQAAGRGQGLELELLGGASPPALLLVDGDREELRLGREQPRSRTVPSPAARALHQLLDPAAAGGDDLAAAAAVELLVAEVHELLERSTQQHPPGQPGASVARACRLAGRRAFAQAARLAATRPDELAARLGLAAALPEGAPAPALSPALPPEPLELWAFRAGLKPVAFLTVRATEVEATLLPFGAAAVVRHERRVSVGPQDAWDDRRDRGEARVELYVSQDRALAERAAALQTTGDPSASLTELGALMGYPPCCVAAFASQDDRSNNSRNRHATAARTAGAGPWPFELANLVAMPVPFFPCSYRCEAALAWSRAALGALAAADPGAAAALRALLSRPVLYFEHDLWISFDGSADGRTLRLAPAAPSPAAVPPGAPALLASFAGALGAAAALHFERDALLIEQRDGPTLSLPRTDPALGFLAPFG